MIERASVWIIEDNEVYRRMIGRSLDRGQAARCTGSFGSITEVRRAAGKYPAPDVVLLDIGLPDMNGIEALPDLRRYLETSKILILTVFDDDEKIFRALCAGAMGYLLKTDALDDLESAITQVLSGGAPMTPAVARKVLHLFSRVPSASRAESGYDLTDREREVLQLMSQGLTKKEIANVTGLSTHTVNSHLRNVYEKLHVTTNTGAVAKAIREGLV